MDLLFILALFALVASGTMYASTAFSVVVAFVLAPLALMLIVAAGAVLVNAFRRS